MLNKSITALLEYALARKMIEAEDTTWAANRVLALVGGDAYAPEAGEFANIEDILKALLDCAAGNGKLSPDTQSMRDVLSADIMDVFMPKPSAVTAEFRRLYQNAPKQATDYFYNLSKNCNYIMTERVKKNIEWQTKTAYGDLVVTVNLSKPEKDPKDIAAAKLQKQTGYPKCLLCTENVGFEGHATHPGRANHRIIPLQLNGEDWFLQYSPYVYYNEHCIVLNGKHTPMQITGDSFRRLLDFVARFPHYFVGSNADLPIVGGSILTHDHFQGGSATLPMAVAPIRQRVEFAGFTDVEAGIVHWPLSTLRLQGSDPARLAALGEEILAAWRAYSDESQEILAYTDAPHNTITPVARQKEGKFQLDLILRNNRTSAEHPLGIFHPHAQYHHIKKENIGLIEAMGLAVLPPRLCAEHNLNDPAVRDEIGDIFAKILENCGVFKDTPAGNQAFLKFVESVK